MSESEFDKQLALARNTNTSHLSPFAQNVMKALRHQETFGHATRIKDKQTIRSLFMKYATTHTRLAFVALAILAISLGFTGYAYAIGTNPISLIKRWITGDTVHIEYQGREFQHGTNKTYSDAAITAYAELNTIDSLHFKASNLFQVPKDGIEHVSPPHSTYTYSWLGTIDHSDSTNVYVHKQYTLGDKVTPPKTENALVAIPKTSLSFYKQGEPSTSFTEQTELVVVYTNKFLQHTIGSHATATPVTQYFIFQLNHGLHDIIEATQQSAPEVATETEMPLYEPSWGGASDICLNNGADRCDSDKQGTDKGISLYQSPSNPQAATFGEGDAAHLVNDLIIRNVQGKIIKITEQNIQIKSSSGSIWMLAYPAARQRSFATATGKPLKIGNTIFGSVIASINDLDNRSFDEQHIYTMRRH